ncbi:GAF domain-containing protein [Duganella lactea]|uniref:GAF domain-containing protein n=1 Tax=Duganella lactea TaxID=2692173 RepID=UPI001E4ADF97|nr:GAF domain-containing protein [Duganella lactea]
MWCGRTDTRAPHFVNIIAIATRLRGHHAAYDKERVAALRELLILDTPPEARFDKIVRFAAREFDVPFALITLLDENRQWFKASVGVDLCETARAISFCDHVILQPDIFIIPDTRADERFADK